MDSGRTLSMIRVELVAPPPASAFIYIWPFNPDEPTRYPQVRICRKGGTWFDVRAGDRIAVRRPKTVYYDIHQIKQISIYRAHPVAENDRVIESVNAWIDEGLVDA